jgi:hypothetical protein
MNGLRLRTATSRKATEASSRIFPGTGNFGKSTNGTPSERKRRKRRATKRKSDILLFDRRRWMSFDFVEANCTTKRKKHERTTPYLTAATKRLRKGVPSTDARPLFEEDIDRESKLQECLR